MDEFSSRATTIFLVPITAIILAVVLVLSPLAAVPAVLVLVFIAVFLGYSVAKWELERELDKGEKIPRLNGKR